MQDNGQFVKERKSLMKKTENPDYDAEALSMDLESQLEKEMKLLESGLGILSYLIMFLFATIIACGW